MKIRRYIGNNTQEAILKVKMDLGNEAVILNTRKVRQKGFLKIFAKPLIEVLAAVDEDYVKKEQPKKIEKSIAQKELANNVTQSFDGVSQMQVKPDVKDKKITELEDKVSNMENTLNKIYNQLQVSSTKEECVATTHEKVQTQPQTPPQQPQSQQTPAPQSQIYEVFYNNLIKNEVETELAKKIIDSVKNKLGENASVNDVSSVLYNLISGMLGKPETMKLNENGKPTVVIFVGPTGVGKTTTLAKIAANYSLNLKKNVGLITADTYRIAAVEQLKTYAEILGMPVSVIYSVSEIKVAISSHSNKDVILIDTPGRSFSNKSQFEELKSLVIASEADEVYLVVSTTTSIRNCKDILSNYGFLKDYKLIFTKLDETPISGIMLNSRHFTGKSLSYITTGQNVPDDIEVANIDKITKNLLGSIT